MSKVALYCRLSKEYEHNAREREYSESIQNQKMILTDFALKNGFEIYKIYSVAGHMHRCSRSFMGTIPYQN